MNTESKSYRLIIFSLWLASIFGPFLNSAVIVLLPIFGKDLSASAVELSLIALLFILGQAVFSVLGGRFNDFLGPKRVMIASATVFFLSTFLTAFVTNISILLVLRLFQGMASAMLSCCCLVIGLLVAPAKQRGQVIGILISAVFLGLALGPVIFAYIIDFLSWRHAFALFIIPGIFAIGFLQLVLKDAKFNERVALGESFDVLGAFLFSLGLGLFIFSVGSLHLFFYSKLLLVLSLFILALFVYKQFHIKSPLIDFKALVFQENFLFGLFLMLVNYSSILGLNYFISIYFQDVKGFSPILSSYYLIIPNIILIASSPLGGKLADKYNDVLIISIGMAISGISIFALSKLNMATTQSYIILFSMLLGLGFGLTNAPSVNYTLTNVDKRNISVASGLTGTIRNLGAILSYSLILIILAKKMGNGLVRENIAQFLESLELSFFAFALICFIGAIILLLRFFKKIKI